jgi:predicted metal-dependent hydrolase
LRQKIEKGLAKSRFGIVVLSRSCFKCCHLLFGGLGSLFSELLDEVLPKFSRYKINKPSLSIRYMSKRWGSCTPSGKIILKAELIKAPKGSIEYVIVHELCHLVHRNHTTAFQNLESRLLPEWRK